MTYRELAEQECPNLVGEVFWGGVEGCPHEHFKAEKPDYCTATVTKIPSEQKCRKCWNREVKEND